MASRKSARLTAKAEAAATAATQKAEPTTIKVATKVQRSRPSKKQKPYKETDGSNDNAIADQSTPSMNSKFMKDVPVDILLEIFGWLEPIDLLHLARVSKNLHELLTSNNVTFLWKLAYKNVEQDYQPPLCPNDTNIVLYTNYLYGRNCQFCASTQGRIYHESAFLRLCSNCADTSFVSLRLDEVDPAVRHLCHTWTFAECKEAGSMILNVEYSQRCKEFEQAQKEKKRQSYFAERDRAVLERASLASRLVRWRKKMQHMKRNKRLAIYSKRMLDIKNKLREEGYTADARALWSNAHRVPHVRKSYPLTDSEWSFIRADIVDFIQAKREERAFAAVRTRLQNRIAQLEEFISQWKIRPTAWWVASSEPIASLVKSDQRRISHKDFDKVEPQLCNLITSWKEETDNYLASLIPPPSGKGKEKDSRDKFNALELATTFFECRWCTEPISHPRILMHDCLVEDQTDAGDEEEKCDMEDLEEDMVVDTRGPRVPRPPKKITPNTVFPTLSDCYSLGMYAGKEGVTYNEKASNAARDIIAACGQDPTTVTHAAMEEMQVRLECLRCSRAMQAKPRAKSFRLVMKWPMALVHELEEHYGKPTSSEPAWGRIDSFEDLAKVKDAEINIKKLRKYKIPVSCNHCLWWSDVTQEQSDHIRSAHKIFVDEDAVSHHFSGQLDASIKTVYPAVKI